MMCADVFFAKRLCQVMRHPLHQTPGVHEDQSRTVLLCKLDDAVINFIPHLIACDRTEQGRRNFYGQIKLPFVTNVDDFRDRTAVASKKMRNLFDGLLRGRKPDTYRSPVSQRLQPSN